jgi:hypothetical protein
MSKKITEYALYKGDTLLNVGTIKEIAEATGTKPSTLHYYATPAYRKRCKDLGKRKQLVRLEDDETEETE